MVMASGCRLKSRRRKKSSAPKPKKSFLPDAVALEHGGLLRGEVELAGAEPVEVALGLAGNIGREKAQRLRVTEIGTGQADGDVEMRGRLDAEDAIDVLEMEAEEFVEEEVGVDGEIGAVPPEPVAALGGVDFPPGCLGAFGRDVALGEALDEEMARFLQPLPALVFLGVADPDVEVAADPRAGMEIAGLDLGGMRVEVIADARQVFSSGVSSQRAVEGGEEGLAAIGEGLPGVLAVENQRGDAAAVGRDLGDVLEIIDQVRDGLGGLVARGIEADEVGERPVAEKRLDRCFVGVDAPALEELDVIDVAVIPRGIVLEALEKIALVGAEIIEAGLDHERNDFRRDGAFRRPEAARALAEDLLVQFLREAELGADVLRRGEGGGQGRLGLATARDVGVVDQRHDGMKIGRGRQLDLAALGGGAIFAAGRGRGFRGGYRARRSFPPR